MPLALKQVLGPGNPVEGVFRERLPVKAFPRLAQTLSDTDGNVETDINVSRAPSGVPLVEGRLRGLFRRDCQRCLEPVELGVDLPIKLAVTPVGAEELAPSDFEPWVAEEGKIALGELLEDELLLELPMVTRHEDEKQCGRLAEKFIAGPEEDLPARENPFAVLRNLKRD